MADVKNEAAPEAYEPPTIEDVPVRPDEQILRGCKSANFQRSPTSGGHVFNLCSNCFSVAPS